MPFWMHFLCFVMVESGEHEEHALIDVFFVFGRRSWGWGWRWVGGARRGGDVSRHKKKKKRQVYLVHPACWFSMPLWPWSPLVCSVMSVAFLMCCGLLISCCHTAVGRAVLVAFWGHFAIPGASCDVFLP